MNVVVLFFLLFFCPFVFSELIQNNGPFYEYEDVYFNPNQETFIFLDNEGNTTWNFLWQPIGQGPFILGNKRRVIFQRAGKGKQIALKKRIEWEEATPIRWEGTTLILIDSCEGFLTHYFHFLEHLIGLWQFGSSKNVGDVKRIVFCSQEQRGLPFTWKGINHINEKLIKALFPNAEVFTLLDIQNQKTMKIHCDRMLISSRISSYNILSCSRVNKMLGASWQDIEVSQLNDLREAVLASLKIPSLPQMEKPRITYVVRRPPRMLMPELENKLIRAIEAEAGLQVNKVDFGTISFEEQLKIVANTDILIGVHGNGLSHILFLPSSATVFELFPATGFTWDYYLLAKIKGIDYYGHCGRDWITSTEDLHHSRFAFHGNLNNAVNELDCDTIIRVIRNVSKKANTEFRNCLNKENQTEKAGSPL